MRRTTINPFRTSVKGVSVLRHYAMKMHGDMVEKLHTFLTSTLDFSLSQYLRYSLYRKLDGRGARLKVVTKRKCPAFVGNQTPVI
jgi:hypothetical protein